MVEMDAVKILWFLGALQTTQPQPPSQSQMVCEQPKPAPTMHWRSKPAFVGKTEKQQHNEEDASTMTTKATAEGPSEMEEEEVETKFHFFWQAGSPFSQWHGSHYTLNGAEYVNAEQGMMHGKAVLFEDWDVAKQIMESSSPRKMKALGRKVKGFDQKTWNKNREQIVYENSVAKFTQNAHMLEALLNTEGTLVEASPSDSIWGIGLHEDDARKTPPSNWKGLNLLGLILTRVRDEIKAGVHDDKLPSKQTEDQAA